LNIVFATDGGYLQHLAVALASLLENNSGMNVYVINNDISSTDWKRLEKLFVGTDSYLIDAKIDDRQIENLITRSYFTKATYYRLFIPDIVKGDRALYLDVDIVINGCIDDLYNTELSNTFLAAVDDLYIQNFYYLEMEHSAKYFNSGVMLINLEYWRAYNVKEKVIEFIRRKPEVISFMDQDGLNSVINGNWLELHPQYNMHTGLLNKECAVDLQIKEAIDNPVIIHYTGSSKPWHFRNNHPYKHLYWKYLRKTPYKYFIPDDLNMINIVKWIVPMPAISQKYIKH
jgi:lipopolysaccharide biosynthesis glycosyltransferase